jgi:xanthine/uracil permease
MAYLDNASKGRSGDSPTEPPPNQRRRRSSLSPLLVPNIARIAVIALGVAVAAVAIAVWFDGNRNDLSDGVVLLGSIALALILVGAVATRGTTRSTVRRRRR